MIQEQTWPDPWTEEEAKAECESKISWRVDVQRCIQINPDLDLDAEIEECMVDIQVSCRSAQ